MKHPCKIGLYPIPFDQLQMVFYPECSICKCGIHRMDIRCTMLLTYLAIALVMQCGRSNTKSMALYINDLARHNRSLLECCICTYNARWRERREILACNFSSQEYIALVV